MLIGMSLAGLVDLMLVDPNEALRLDARSVYRASGPVLSGYCFRTSCLVAVDQGCAGILISGERT